MGALKLLIESIGLFKARRIDVQHGINCWALLVISLNPIQVLLNQTAARQSAGLHRLMNAGDGSFHQVESAIRRAVGARYKQKGKKKGNVFYAHECNSLLKNE
jgi:hypothetical protein